jgi:thioredoxin-related protein
MKNLLLIFLTLGLFACSSSSSKEAANTAVKEPDNYVEIPWATMGKIESLVAKKPRKTIVDVYTPWCGPCKMMDRNTFTNPEIINQIGKNFYAVKFNAEGPDPISFLGKEYANPQFKPKKRGRNAPHQLSGFFSVRGYPTLVVLDENMKIIDKIVGYKTPEQLKVELTKHM